MFDLGMIKAFAKIKLTIHGTKDHNAVYGAGRGQHYFQTQDC